MREIVSKIRQRGGIGGGERPAPLAARHGGDDFDGSNAGQVEVMPRLRVCQERDPGTASLLGIALHQRTTIQEVHRHYRRSSRIVSDNGVLCTWSRVRCRAGAPSVMEGDGGRHGA